MGKKSKRPSGFNTPFADLTPPAAPPPPPAATPTPPEPPAAEPPDEASLFRAAMQGVIPVTPAKGRVEPPKRETSALPDDEALAIAELHALVRGEGEFRLFDSDEEQSGMAPGVSFELVERLRQGAFAFRRHLDLHGRTREEAKEELAAFITQARRDGERCVLVITGRGKGSPDGVSVLREALPRWMSRHPLRSHVLAFCSARPNDGGPGAFYVLLRRPGVHPYGGVAP